MIHTNGGEYEKSSYYCSGLLVNRGRRRFDLSGIKKNINDVEIISTDGTTKFTLENATYEDTTSAPYALTFRISDINTFYSNFVENNPYYIYTLNGDGSRCRGEGELYFFCKDGHYFYLDMGNVYADLVEAVIEINTWEQWYAMISPFLEQSISASKDVFFAWEDTWGLLSFADLVEFYERTSPEHYRVDEAAQSIYVDMYKPSYADSGWLKEAVTLSVVENGVVLSVSPEYTD